VNLLELLRLDAGGDGPKVETIQGTPVYRLRGQLLPLVSLREQLGLDATPSDTTTHIAVLQADDRQFGLVVDDIQDTEEIVVKPLGTLLRHIDMYAGATIMGDGEVALILDTTALAEHAGVLAENARQPDQPDHAVDDTDRAQLLLMSLSDGRRLGLNLDMVDRLEEVQQSAIEQVGGYEVVQYRQGMLPLVRLDRLYGADQLATEQDQAAQDRLQVVVCLHREVLVGLVVSEILDIVDDALAVRSALGSGGRYGSVVVDGRVTEILDVGHAVGDLDVAMSGPVSALTSLAVPTAAEV
jgi:two-component system chemotaxis sensor kinase CheA